MSGQNHPGQGTAIVAGTADRFGELVITSSKAFVKKNPVISLTWVAGLLISMLATGFTPSLEAQNKYEAKIRSLDHVALDEAVDDMIYWQDAYRSSRGFFWGCNDQCQQNKQEYERSKQTYDAVNRDYLQNIAEAKSEVGLFSRHGVEETRGLFWEKVAGGKRFAKRATMWDALFIGIGSTRRDEGAMSVIVRIAFRMLINLTVGLFMAVVEFLFAVWRVIWSYQPDTLSTTAFFVMAAVGAISLLATWVLGIAALGVTGVYAVAKVAENAQIEAARRGQDTRFSTSRIYAQQQQRQPGYQQQPFQRPYTYQHQQDARRRQPAEAAPSSSTSNWDHLD